MRGTAASFIAVKEALELCPFYCPPLVGLVGIMTNGGSFMTKGAAVLFYWDK